MLPELSKTIEQNIYQKASVFHW